MTRPSVQRRAFLKATGATALGIGFALYLPARQGNADTGIDAGEDSVEVMSWIVVHPDNTVTITVPQTELGQGVSTTIPQILADELDLDWSRVNSAFYDPRINAERDNVFVWTATLGSLSAHFLFESIRTAAAQLRAMFVQVAASRLRVDAAELTVAASRVIHTDTSRSYPFASLALEASKRVPPALEQLELKAPAQRKLIGKPVRKFDIPAITTGSKEFGIDVEMPGMRFAAIRQSPVTGAKLIGFDATSIAHLRGNPVASRIEAGTVGYNSPVPEGDDPDLWAALVRTDDAVAVVADSWWQAKSALDALTVNWSESEHRAFSSAALDEALTSRVQAALPLVSQAGDVDQAFEQSQQRLSAVYRYPFMDPAPLEPMNCTVLVSDREVHVWSNSQYADDAWRIACELTGVDPQHTHLHLLPAGGGFGRRLHNDFVFQAVQIAKQHPGTPVKMLATREESTRHSYYAPLTVTRFDAGIDQDGALLAWRCRIASGFSADKGFGATRIPFHVPNTRFEYYRDQTTPIPFGWMRGVGFTEQLWMNFSFLDECRLAAGREPIEFYRELLDPDRALSADGVDEAAVNRLKRHRKLLDHAVENRPWSAPKPAGTGRGIAFSDSDYYEGYGSSTKVAIVDVRMDENGKPIVEHVYIAIDVGTAINPDVVHGQLEGGVAYALTTALMSEITVVDGQVQQSNFHDYPILKMAAMPQVQIDVLESGGNPMSVGEDAVPITIAALINAIVDAGGPRARRLPIYSAIESTTS